MKNKETRAEAPLRLLILDDSDDDATLMVRELRKVCSRVATKRVESRDEFVSEASSGQWDIILCDYNLPDFSAPEALELLREQHSETPAIIVSGFVGEEAAADIMRAGARDYVSKGNLARLGPAVVREIQEAETRRQRSQIEEELRQSQKLESIGRLAGGLAHDVNNQLMIIQGFAELGLKSSDEDPKANRFFDRILKASKNAELLTSQLLTFSRRQRMNPVVVNINDLINETRRMLRGLIPENVEIETRLSKGVKPTKVDRHQMEQVIINMAVNAKDAMPNGGTLALETSMARGPSRENPSECVRISVIDTGSGMSEDVKAHIFEPFFTTKEAGKGTGLGLATCYGIVTQFGGEITVKSKPGAGTRFDIWLPLTEEYCAPAIPRPRQNREAPHGRETVLVVEDQENVRLLMAEALREQGYDVLEASDGVEAMHVVEEKGIADLHMLLTDVVMPRMGGVQLAERLRDQRPELVVLFVSGYAMDLLDYNAQEDFWFMKKPFSLDDLAQTVREALDNPKAQSVR